MNSVLNSDSEQCTESRLGWVHRVHTLNPGCAPTARTQPVSWHAIGRIVAPSRSCRGSPLPCHCAHARTGAPCRSLPAYDTKIVSRHIASTASAPRALPCISQLPASYRGALLRRIASLLQCIATQRSPPPPLSHDTKFCIATLR